MAKLAELVVGVSVNTRKFARGLNTMQSKMRSAGRKMQSIGRTMTRAITLPLTAAGGAAAKFAIDFEKQMKDVKTAVGATEEEMKKIRPAIKNVAKETGQSFEDITEAAKLAQSSSLSLSQANETLQQTAKASAAGFGDMRSLMNFTTTAMVKFRREVDGSNQVLNTLIGTAQETQAQVNQFIPAFSQSLGTLNSLNIGLEKGAALFAGLADQARNTRSAGVQFAALLKKLAKPTNELRKFISQNFVSMKKFRKEVGQNTLSTLKKFNQAVRNSDKSFEQLLSRKRAFLGAQNLFVNNMQKSVSVMKQQSKKQNSLSKAFKQTSSVSRKLSKAWNKLKVALKPLGNEILNAAVPALEEMIKLAEKMSNKFENLSKGSKKFAGKLGLIAVAAGPVVAILGTMAVALGSLSAPILAVTAGVVGLIGVFNDFGAIKSFGVEAWLTFLKEFGKSVKENFNTFVKWISSSVEAISTLFDPLNLLGGVGNFGVDEWITFFKEFTKSIVDTGKAVVKWIINKFSFLANKMTDWTSSIADAWESLGDKLVFGSIIPKMTTQIANLFSDLNKKTVQSTKAMTSNVEKQYDNMSSNIQVSMDKMIKSINNPVKSLKKLITKRISGKSGLVGAFLTGMQKINKGTEKQMKGVRNQFEETKKDIDKLMNKVKAEVPMSMKEAFDLAENPVKKGSKKLVQLAQKQLGGMAGALLKLNQMKNKGGGAAGPVAGGGAAKNGGLAPGGNNARQKRGFQALIGQGLKPRGGSFGYRAPGAPKRKSLGLFASGGTFGPGQSMIVGENGPELIDAKASGGVINNKQLQKMGGGGNNFSFGDIVLNGDTSNTATAERIKRDFKEKVVQAVNEAKQEGQPV